MSRRPREGRKPGRNKNGIIDQRKGSRLRQQRAFRARSNGLPTPQGMAKATKPPTLPRTYNEKVLATVCPKCGESDVCRKVLSVKRYSSGTDYEEFVIERKLGGPIDVPHEERWEAAADPAKVKPNNQPEGVTMSEQNIENVEGDVNVEPTEAPEPGPEDTDTDVDPGGSSGDSNDPAPSTTSDGAGDSTEGGDTSGDEAQQDTGALQE